jgi:predicted amidohydrolase
MPDNSAIRVAAVQLAPRLLQVGENVKHALDLMEGATADLFVLPELFTSGYTFARSEEVATTASRAGEGPAFAALADFARARNCFLCYGFPEADRDGSRFYNAAALVGPAGHIATYRKMHLFGREKLFFSPGATPAPVITLPLASGVRVGLMICFDWYFPEVARSLALRGAQILLHPSNLVLPHCPAAMITRSLENRVFSVTSDRVGTERNGPAEHSFIGSSQIVSPKGQVLARLGNVEEAVAVAEILPSDADSKFVTEFNDLFADRQPDLYPFSIS